MSDTDNTMMLLDTQKGRSPQEVAAESLSIEKVQATVDRVIRNRMRKMDRYNSLALFKEARAAKDAKCMPGDTPDIQTLFKLKDMLDEADGIEDLYNRMNVKSGLMKQITTLEDRLEDQNGKIVAELQALLKREDEKSSKGGIDMGSLLKLAEKA